MIEKENWKEYSSFGFSGGVKTSSRKGYSYSAVGFYLDISIKNGLYLQSLYHIDSDLLRSSRRSS